ACDERHGHLRLLSRSGLRRGCAHTSKYGKNSVESAKICKRFLPRNRGLSKTVRLLNTESVLASRQNQRVRDACPIQTCCSMRSILLIRNRWRNSVHLTKAASDEPNPARLLRDRRAPDG